MKAVASQNSEAFASLRAIADHSFDSVAAGKVFEGRAVNYDSKTKTIHHALARRSGTRGCGSDSQLPCRHSAQHGRDVTGQRRRRIA